MDGVRQALGMVSVTSESPDAEMSISYGTGDGRQDKQVGASVPPLTRAYAWV